MKCLLHPSAMTNKLTSLRYTNYTFIIVPGDCVDVKCLHGFLESIFHNVFLSGEQTGAEIEPELSRFPNFLSWSSTTVNNLSWSVIPPPTWSYFSSLSFSPVISPRPTWYYFSSLSLSSVIPPPTWFHFSSLSLLCTMHYAVIPLPTWSYFSSLSLLSVIPPPTWS